MQQYVNSCLRGHMAVTGADYRQYCRYITYFEAATVWDVNEEERGNLEIGL